MVKFVILDLSINVPYIVLNRIIIINPKLLPIPSKNKRRVSV